MSLSAAVPLAITVALAFLGFVATYLNNLRIDQRKARLDRVNRQLSNLYGPLYALSWAAHIAWVEFRAQYRRPEQPFWTGSPPPTDEEKAGWRLWMNAVFMPANRKMKDTIIHNAELLVEEEIPKCLLDLCAHVSSYEALQARWGAGDYRDHLALVNFPTEVREYAKSAFLRLKAEQGRLIGIKQSAAARTDTSSP